jgi:hypothetical protein
MFFVFMGIAWLFHAWFKFQWDCLYFQVQERRCDDDGTVVGQGSWCTMTPDDSVKETQVNSQTVSILFSPVSTQIHTTAVSLHCSVENSTATFQLARLVDG